MREDQRNDMIEARDNMRQRRSNGSVASECFRLQIQ